MISLCWQMLPLLAHDLNIGESGNFGIPKEDWNRLISYQFAWAYVWGMFRCRDAISC